VREKRGERGGDTIPELDESFGRFSSFFVGERVKFRAVCGDCGVICGDKCKKVDFSEFACRGEGGGVWRRGETAIVARRADGGDSMGVGFGRREDGGDSGGISVGS